MNQISQVVHHPEPPVAVTESSPERPRKPMGERELLFLAEATRLLGESLEVEKTLTAVARLSLPHLGSWCIVDLCEGDHIRRLAILHPDPKQQALADDLLAGWPPGREDPVGVPSAVRSGRSEVVFPVTDEMLAGVARSPENLAILRALEIGSIMTVPLRARGAVLGAITYVSPNHGDSFSERDLALAEGVALRCAMAIDIARLLQTARLAEAAAESARAEAEGANLAKVRFLSLMSHELRTPLNAIAGYAELLETGIRGPLSEVQLADVRRIQANQRHLLGLVESVLTYAKTDAGNIEFRPEEVPLGLLLAEVYGTMSPLIVEKGASCSGCEAEDSADLTVYADPEKLRQILINLLANAIKFSGEGGRIQVTHQHAGEKVEIRIADDGIGIAAEHRERIFDPFVQVEEGLADRHGGTGLGLAISLELAIGMGGDLRVESELGRGSTFILTLPGVEPARPAVADLEPGAAER